MAESFAATLLRWYHRHGRHDLPWQHPRSLYRVWVSEIMLQQTQVKTVIPYFQAFMQRFPELASLAQAPVDEVLQSWQGLGYYRRARNLHRAARQVMAAHGGDFPRDYEAVLALPGIGPSTAAAILAQALGQPHAILDGNVKRVLARYHGVEGWPGEKAVEAVLWDHARQHTPSRRVADYTQAIMDLGATVCRRSRPDCDACPLSGRCVARQQDRVADLPTRKPAKTLPTKQRRFLLIQEASAVLMEKRPDNGIWGGLWSLPELAMAEDVATGCQQRWGLKVIESSDLEAFRHTFSHFHLDITPCRVTVAAGSRHRQECRVDETGAWRWLCPGSTVAVATPVRHILEKYTGIDQKEVE